MFTSAGSSIVFRFCDPLEFGAAMNRLMERNAIRLTCYTRMGPVSLLVCRRKFPAKLTNHRRGLRREKFKFQAGVVGCDRNGIVEVDHQFLFVIAGPVRKTVAVGIPRTSEVSPVSDDLVAELAVRWLPRGSLAHVEGAKHILEFGGVKGVYACWV